MKRPYDEIFENATVDSDRETCVEFSDVGRYSVLP